LSYASWIISYYTFAPCVVCNDLGGALSKIVQLAFEAILFEKAHIWGGGFHLNNWTQLFNLFLSYELKL
jgi:hypothetical protein